MTRRRVQPESVVIIGDSRGWYDLDLDELQKGLGKRPVQLAMAGSCAYPVLADLADDENFSRHDHLQLRARDCFLLRRAHPQWNAAKKRCAGLTRKRPHNAPANIWRCHWKNMSRFSNRKT